MNKKTRNISLLALAAGIVIIPAIRYFINKSRKIISDMEGLQSTPERTKGIFSAYRGGHLPHHRKAHPHDGQMLH